MIQLGCMTGCGSIAWMQRHAANPSVGVRRQLPLHKGAVFAFLHRACPARQRPSAWAVILSLPLPVVFARAKKSPPCAKGGQHGRAMQGGLQSQANDSAGCCDRVREHRLAVPTRDREHRLGAEARRQSLSRRSPTAPFAQGRSGGRTAILSLPWLVVLAWEKRV